MATATALRPVVPGWSARARVLGWTLLACWLVVSAYMLVAVPRDSSLAALSGSIAAGEVDTIQVRGGLPDEPGHSGYADLVIRWRSGLFVREVRLREARPVTAEARDTELEVVPSGVVGRLRVEHPQLEVERGGDAYANGLSLSMFGHDVMGWPARGGLTLMVVTLGLLIAGPEPWRATRWAWFWLFGVTPPLGVLAYLALGGPTALARVPQPGSRRLTGGWAFLLTLLISGTTATVVWFA